MTDLLDSMVEVRLPWTSPTITSWCPGGDLRAALREGLAVDAARVGDAEFGREFRDALATLVTGTPEDPLAWANHRLDLPGGGWAVTGPRFRGGDAGHPFVDVVATTEPPTADGLAVVAETVLPAYAAFAPLSLRVDAPDPDDLVAALRDDPRFAPDCAVDMYVVAGLVSALRQHPRASAYASVSLVAGDSGRLASRVAEIYAELGAAQPDLAQWANPEDAESLAASAGEGLLFEVLVDGDPSGVVAGLHYDAHGMRGFSVKELCLDAEHRGRRLAPAAVQRLVDELPSRPDDVLWGTIHPANAPSLRNALSIGREVVGGYVWVRVAGVR